MVTFQSICEVLKGLFRTQFDVMMFDFENNFYVEILDNNQGFEGMRYPKITITVWPNGKPPEEQ